MRKRMGFSLIELLLVVAIIMIIAAIAIPRLLRARMAANESTAANQIRTLSTAEVSYVTNYPSVGYGTLAALGGALPCTPSSATACVIDNSFATDYSNNGKNGYQFAIAVPSSDKYVATTWPISAGSTGINSFCSIEDAVVRKDSTGTNDTGHDTCGGLPSAPN